LAKASAELINPEKALTATIPNCSPRHCAQGAWAAGEEILFRGFLFRGWRRSRRDAPVATGLVASLARPGGNVTGLSNQTADLAGKRLELLREIIPDLRRLAILSNVGNPIGVLEMAEVQAAARTLGLEVLPLEIRRAEDIAPAFESLKDRAQALYVVAEPSRAMPGSARMPPQSTFQSCNSSTSAFSDGTMPTVTFVAWFRSGP
jgi:ABC transporter substrate binding protein